MQVSENIKVVGPITVMNKTGRIILLTFVDPKRGKPRSIKCPPWVDPSEAKSDGERKLCGLTAKIEAEELKAILANPMAREYLKMLDTVD